MKTRVATADGLVVQLRERNVGSSTSVVNWNNTLATIQTDVESLNE